MDGINEYLGVWKVVVVANFNLFVWQDREKN
jgi:hypothetical protein